MGLQYGGVTPNKIYYNNADVKSVYYNNVKIWEYKLFEGNLAVGNTVIFDNKSWLVVNKLAYGTGANRGNTWSLGLSTTFGDKVQWDIDNEDNSYIASTIFLETLWNYQITKMSTEALSHCVTDQKFHDRIYKVYIPSANNVYTMTGNVEDGTVAFAGYNTPAKRICNDSSGTPVPWWTSSYMDKAVHYVEANGGVNAVTGATSHRGFRPHVDIRTDHNGALI